MSSISDFGLDLEHLFQPAWAQEKSEANRYEKFAGEPAEREDRKREGRRGRFGGGSPGERRGPRPPREGRARHSMRAGNQQKGGAQRTGAPYQRVEPPAPLPDMEVAFIPVEKGVDSLARQIKMTGRAYPLFQIAFCSGVGSAAATDRLGVVAPADP